MDASEGLIPETLRQTLVAEAEKADTQTAWPEVSWKALRQSGVTAWVVPAEFGGAGWDARRLLEGYGSLARSCLTTAFLLSQRDAAIRRLVQYGERDLCRELLPPLARGERFATVGIAQLTTSRQHAWPALLARLDTGRLILNGQMPWVSGATRADVLVAGAVLADGRQVLAVVPTTTAGVRVEPALDLMALQGSRTASVLCQEVSLDRRWLLAGPAHHVLAGDPAAGLAPSALALGLARAALDYLAGEAAKRPELDAVARRLTGEHERLWATLLAQAAGTAGTPAPSLRAEAASLVLRSTQAALTASKGSGFVHPHPCQRWARQALFFLVWSCPRPAAEAILECFAPEEECPAPVTPSA